MIQQRDGPVLASTLLSAINFTEESARRQVDVATQSAHIEQVSELMESDQGKIEVCQKLAQLKTALVVNASTRCVWTKADCLLSCETPLWCAGRNASRTPF